MQIASFQFRETGYSYDRHVTSTHVIPRRPVVAITASHETSCFLLQISAVLMLKTFIQIEKITCGSMGGGKSFAMKCFVLV